MLDNLDELRTFHRILALGSLSAAARELGVALAVVSKRLATLERRAGVRLISRTTRKLSPTEEGRSLLLHVERMLDALNDAEAQIFSAVQKNRTAYCVSARQSLSRVYILSASPRSSSRVTRSSTSS